MIKPIVFKETKQRRTKVETPQRARPAKRKPPKNPREEIRGIPVGSSYEANVADALDALGWDYWYQYEAGGGRRLRGGMVVDFIIWTRPAATPLWVNGRYWHAQRRETDKLQQARLKGLVGFPTTDALEMFDEDAETYEDAYQFLLSKIGKG
jgi:hypothetical protein